MDLITAFMTTGELPANKAEAWRIKYKSIKYHIVNGILYRRGYMLPSLRYVYLSLVSRLLYEIHEGTCSSHVRGRALSRRALLQEIGRAHV